MRYGHANGVQRWYCKDCERCFIGHHRLRDEEVNSMYWGGTKTVSDIARECGVSERTIYRRLSRRHMESRPQKKGRAVVLLMDATYWGCGFGVVIMKDHVKGDVLWYKFISGKETLADYKEGVTYLEERGFRIQCIVSDGLKGLRETFPQYKFQLCQFHQMMTIRTKLTLHPKLEASRELLGLAKTLCHTDKESFIGALDAWHTKWGDFLKERAVGRDKKSHYVHKATRSAYLSLKRNMPWLWTWYDNPGMDIPNTNNSLEALNSDLKTKLNLHKGMTKERRKVFIQGFLNAHNHNRQRR